MVSTKPGAGQTSTAREELSNALHLIGRERILLPKLDAFVPCPLFGRALFRHSLSRCSCLEVEVFDAS
jgi:hypothetical protein